MALFPGSCVHSKDTFVLKLSLHRSLSLSLFSLRAVYLSNSISYQFQRVIEDSRNKSDSRFFGFLMR
jgi:hypothetical protein